MEEVQDNQSKMVTKMWPEVGDPVRMDVVGADRDDDNFARVFGPVVKLNRDLTPERVKALRDSIVAAIDRKISAWAAGTFTARFTDDEVLGSGDFEAPEDAAKLASYLGREF